MAEADAVLHVPPVEDIGAADVVVGIATHDNRDTACEAVEAILAGVERHLSSRRAVLVHADGGSRDGTPERVREAVGKRIPLVQVSYPVYPVHKLLPPLAGVPGKAEALRATFALAGQLGSAACTLIDVNVRGIRPEWVDVLVRPVLEHGFDFVAPRYQRHPFEGTIISGIVFPLVRALYGKRIRQPVGGDQAYSARFIEHCTTEGWDGETSLGTDLRLTLTAIAGEFRICQASLGERVIQAGDAQPDVSAVLAHVLGPLFETVDNTVSLWQRTRGSDAVPVFGSHPEIAGDPAPVNVRRMVESFRLGSQDLQEVWNAILPPATLLEFKKMARRPDEEFRMPDEVWARTIYDFALGYRLRVIDRNHLLRAMTPIYLGWLASFVNEMRDRPERVEERLEALCLVFEAQKRYLISRWRWPDRFRP
jgi:hypothetical protein